MRLPARCDIEIAPIRGVAIPTRGDLSPLWSAKPYGLSLEGMYQFLLVIHIVSAIAWLGGAMVLLWAFRAIRVAEGDVVADRAWSQMERTTRIFNPAPFLVVATGLVMVVTSDAWSFSQPWIYLAVVFFVVSLLLGAGFADRWVKQMEAARERGEVASELFDRFLRLGAIELAILIGIVFLMVYKPI